VASTFFRYLFTCSAFRPGDPNNANVAAFCEPELDRKIDRALSLQTSNPSAAQELWAQVDREITDQPPWIPLYNPTATDIVSKRVGNYQYSPNGFGMLIDQLWVR
jgi:peptide/nickel transport system substrate-binding protein